MVFEKEILDYECVHNESSCYNSLFKTDEKEVLVKLAKTVFNRDFTNEKSVRLEDIEIDGNMKVSVSLSEFYEFLVTNFSLLNMDKLLENASMVERNLLLRIKHTLDDSSIKSFDDILHCQFLSNIIAVSCLIQDRKGNVLLTRRNNNVGIANGFLSVSVTGSVDYDDYCHNDPFVACCEREVEEELGYMVNKNSEIRFKKIVCGEKKLQPIALMDMMVDDIQEVVDALINCKDFEEENSSYYVCKAREVENMLNSGQYKTTEAGLIHLRSVI